MSEIESNNEDKAIERYADAFMSIIRIADDKKEVDSAVVAMSWAVAATLKMVTNNEGDFNSCLNVFAEKTKSLLSDVD